MSDYSLKSSLLEQSNPVCAHVCAVSLCIADVCSGFVPFALPVKIL